MHGFLRVGNYNQSKAKGKSKKGISFNLVHEKAKETFFLALPTNNRICMQLCISSYCCRDYLWFVKNYRLILRCFHRIQFVLFPSPSPTTAPLLTKQKFFRNGKVPRLQPCADLARLNRPSRSVTARTCVEADRSSLTPFLVAGQ